MEPKLNDDNGADGTVAVAEIYSAFCESFHIHKFIKISQQYDKNQ